MERGSSDVVLEVRGLTQRYGEQEILHDLHLELPSGSVTLLEGRSGSGKSTLFRLLAALHRPTAGVIRLDGEDVTRLDDDALSELRLRKLGLVFQSFNLLPELTAHENVRLPMELAGVKRRDANERARELLETVGLAHRQEARPSILSGGEQQRVALARALANRPSLVLADEPTGNLDRNNAAAVYDLIASINRTLGSTFLIITHDEMARQWFPRRMFLEEGRLMADPDARSSGATPKPPMRAG